ncbi:MAG: RidA family protein [Opitutales bacterium]
MDYEAKLELLGFDLPETPAPGGNYVPAVRVGNLVYTAGTICIKDGEMTHTGKVGEGQTVESGYAGAQVCALNLLAAIKGEAGSLNNLKRFLTVNGYVNAVAGFPESPRVINGASDLFVSVFGERGKHARAAVAVAGLPRDSTVEVQCVVELEG